MWSSIAYEPLQERLQALRRTHSGRMASQRRIQERVIDTLGRYDDYVSLIISPHIAASETDNGHGDNCR